MESIWFYHEGLYSLTTPKYKFREEATSALAGVHAFPYPGRIGIWSASFCGERKTGEPGEKPSEQA